VSTGVRAVLLSRFVRAACSGTTIIGNRSTKVAVCCIHLVVDTMHGEVFCAGPPVMPF
jgi:hypothetical protein